MDKKIEIKEMCRTCKYYTPEEHAEEQFATDPCIACIRNPDYNDCWELEKDIIKEELDLQERN